MYASEMTFEEYAAYCLSRYPTKKYQDTHVSEAVSGCADTVPPDSNESCPVTVRSNGDRDILTPVVSR